MESARAAAFIVAQGLHNSAHPRNDGDPWKACAAEVPRVMATAHIHTRRVE